MDVDHLLSFLAFFPPLLYAPDTCTGYVYEGVWEELACLPQASALLVIDGYEQLGFWTRRTIRARCRRAAYGLLVTAHRPAGLPDLHRTSTNVALAQQVLDALLREDDRRILPELDLAGLLARRRGNLREVLFDLYDVYEQNRVRALSLAPPETAGLS
jgi:hypothetical protein